MANAARTPSIFLATYIAALLAASAATGFDRIDDRLLAPIYVPLLTVVLMATERVVSLARRGSAAGAGGRSARGGDRRGPSLARALIFAAAAIWLSGSAIRTAKMLDEAWVDGPGGFNVAAWRGSDLAARLRNVSPEGVLLCNEPAAAFILAGKEALQSPRRTLYHSSERAGDDLRRLDVLTARTGRFFSREIGRAHV